MTESSRETVVCSWNEWDRLKHVIVGRAVGTQIQAPEPAVQLDFPDYGYPLGTFGPLPEEMEEKGLESIEQSLVGVALPGNIWRSRLSDLRFQPYAA